jgi:sigma-E factor negative regulatory protein RseC
MIEETGTVTAVEKNSLCVETIQLSTCGSCRARKGCGQQILSKIGVASANVKALIGKNDSSNYVVGDVVTIGIPENIVVNSSLLIYCLPLVMMMVFSGVAHTFLMNDGVMIVMGLLGLLFGGLLVRLYSKSIGNNPDYQPIVMIKSAVEKNIEVTGGVSIKPVTLL